jgi:hypothetical protein
MRKFIPVSLFLAVGCGSPASNLSETETDLTSATARARSLEFASYVYVDAGATDSDILRRVREQTQSAFGALRTSEISVNSRELKDVDTTTFVKEEVTVWDTDNPTTGKPMTRVRYRYKDSALVPAGMARRSAIPLAVLGSNYRSQTARILEECTANDDHAQDFSSSIWYVFEPSLSNCQTAMGVEQKQIDDSGGYLLANEVSTHEVNRLYLPITIALGPDATATGRTYPEYHRLYKGGIKTDALVIGMVSGTLDHEPHPSLAGDSGWTEWMTQLKETFGTRAFKVSKVEPAEDLTVYQVGGKTIKAAGGFSDVMNWSLNRATPPGVSYGEREALLAAAAAKLGRHWITFTLPVKVAVDGEPERDFAIEILTYFGAGSDQAPHKFAIKNSDVFIYNGHSYIGYGPLDPSRFTADDFPPSYQMLFIDSCVSYNYYERDYISLKSGGTKNLDLITNGLEAPSWRSGYALGRFANLLTNGTNASYLDLLGAASATDALRVVDGEIGNEFTPENRSVTVTFE